MQQEWMAVGRLRERRARAALEQAPDVAFAIRSRMTHTDGRTERGEAFQVERTPLLTAEADDVDALYVRLIEWVRYWGQILGDEVPSTVRVAWKRIDEDSRAAAPEKQHMGFKARTTPEGARFLLSMLTSWLLIRHERMEEGSARSEYFDDVTTLIWSMRSRYGQTAAREKLVAPRPCPACGEAGIRAVWGSEELLDVLISCEVCGFEPKAPRASQIERWLS